MTKLGAFFLLVAIAASAMIAPADAGWKKRGWYLKKPGAECVMRNVSVTTPSGKVVVQKVRVCS